MLLLLLVVNKSDHKIGFESHAWKATGGTTLGGPHIMNKKHCK